MTDCKQYHNQNLQNSNINFTQKSTILNSLRKNGIAFYCYLVPRSKNEPTTVANKTVAATRKSQCWSGLTQRYELLQNVA